MSVSDPKELARYTLADYNQMVSKLFKGEEDAIAWLEEKPALALCGPEWRQKFPGKPPLIFAAITRKQARFVDALLKKGSSPNTLVNPNNPSTTALNHALDVANDRTALAIASMLAKHPDCAHAYEKEGEYYPSARAAVNLFNMDMVKDDVADRQKLFLQLLHAIPARTMLAHDPDILWIMLQEATNASIPPEHFGFMVQALVNHGMNLSLNAPESVGHPLNYALNRVCRQTPDETSEQNKIRCRNANIENAAQLLAAGTPLSLMLQLQTYENWEQLETPSFAMHLQRLSRGSTTEKELARRIIPRAQEILREEIRNIGADGVERFLFTSEGRTTWQAQGCAHQGMLEEVLSPLRPGNRLDERSLLALTDRLEAALPPEAKPYVYRTILRREHTLAQPSTSATVQYLRGGVAEVSPGSKA